MSTTTIQVNLNLTFQDSFLKPHEKEYINELARESSAVRQSFLDAFQTWAGAELRKRVDAAAFGAFGGVGTFGSGSRAEEDSFRMFGQRKYGRPVNWEPQHENCRCSPLPVAQPRINVTVPDSKALAESFRRVFGPKADIRQPHKPSTRKEAAAADRIARRVTADIKAAALKTKRAQAARKGHLTRAAKRRPKAARKRKVR